MIKEVWLLIPTNNMPSREMKHGGDGSTLVYGIRVFALEQEALNYGNGNKQWTIEGPFMRKHERSNIVSMVLSGLFHRIRGWVSRAYGMARASSGHH